MTTSTIPIKAKLFKRFIDLEATTPTDEDTFELSFSSETPVERAFGSEVLSHLPGAANLARLNDSAPLLWKHCNSYYISIEKLKFL